MKYKAKGFNKENIDDLKTFIKGNRLIRKFIKNFVTMLLILYLIIISIGSVVLNIKFNASIVAMSIIAIIIAYFIFRQSAYLRLIRDFKRLNNNFLEISEESVEFISKNQIRKLSRSDIRAIYSLPNTFFIATQGYYRNEKKRNVYFVSAIPKSIFNSDEEYNIFLNSFKQDKIKQLI